MYEPIQNTRPDTERLLQSMATHDERGGGPALAMARAYGLMWVAACQVSGPPKAVVAYSRIAARRHAGVTS